MNDIVEMLRAGHYTQHNCDLAADELEQLRELVRWAYTKLYPYSFSKQEDALKMDEMKLWLEHGL